MTMGEAISNGFRNYACFAGRASRSEMWFFALFYALAYLAASAVDLAMTMQTGAVFPLCTTLTSLALLLPAISVEVRRLHDVGRSGWWLWLCLVPVLGTVALLIWFCARGTPGANRYGPPDTRAVQTA